jgi:hypothetical protein
MKTELRDTSYVVYGDLGPDRMVSRKTRYEIYDGSDYTSLVALCKCVMPLIAQRLNLILEKISHEQEQFVLDLVAAQATFQHQVLEYEALGFWKRLITGKPLAPNGQFMSQSVHELKTMREFFEQAEAIFGKLEKFADFPGMFFHEECDNTVKNMIEWVHNEKT